MPLKMKIVLCPAADIGLHVPVHARLIQVRSTASSALAKVELLQHYLLTSLMTTRCGTCWPKAGTTPILVVKIQIRWSQGRRRWAQGPLESRWAQGSLESLP